MRPKAILFVIATTVIAASSAAGWHELKLESCDDCLVEPTRKCSAVGIKWPTSGGIILTEFGAPNEGMNVALPIGSAVKAMQSGTVTFVKTVSMDYGGFIVLRHDGDEYKSVYAYLSATLVKKGDHVKRSETIALSGTAPRNGASELHFELRKGSTPTNPRFCLPGRGIFVGG